MKIAVLFSIARQVEGEWIFVNVTKAHVNPEVLHEYVKQNQLPLTGVFGEVECVIEYGIIENIEVEDE